MFRLVKFGRYVIVHAICHVSLNVRIKREKKKDNIESLGRLCVYLLKIGAKSFGDGNQDICKDTESNLGPVAGF